MPTESYTFPTAIIGVPIESASEAAAVRNVVDAHAKEYGLHLYRREDSDFFAESCRKEPRTCPDFYSPANPRMREGFGMSLNEFSERCFVIELYEYSGNWTRRSLRALQILQDQLVRKASSSAKLLVRPKREQNWPGQVRPHAGLDPERPPYLEELCVRMGLPDPRKLNRPDFPGDSNLREDGVYGNRKAIFGGSTGAGGADGVGAPGRAGFAMGHDVVLGVQDRLYGAIIASLGGGRPSVIEASAQN